MREDPRDVLLGEDLAGGAGGTPSLVDAGAGAFGVTKGLIQEFCPEKVIDTPILEMVFIGAEIAAIVSAEVFDYLDYPVLRGIPPHAHVPFSPLLEQYYLPNSNKIVESAMAMLAP
jgi:pyruvate/2-oxoglutarate/acetoin dehydrogenase E1 component